MAILGIDEVGRGPWAGPLVVAACVLDSNHPIVGLADSKKLTARRREQLSTEILKYSHCSLAWIDASHLDRIGLSAALREAARSAVRQIDYPFHEIVIDGTVNFLSNTPLARYVTTLKKADSLIDSVSAASIVAKVARDHYMRDLAILYPQYGFEKHVGYGTAMHRQAIQQFGLCPEHRRSFRPIQVLSGANSTSAPRIELSSGAQAELAVAQYLEDRGHEIIARNWRTPLCEIDIVSLVGCDIYFTEVKYRRDNKRGGGLAAIDSRKLRQMHFAAENFLKWYPCSFRPHLAAASVAPPHFLVQDFLVLQ